MAVTFVGSDSGDVNGGTTVNLTLPSHQTDDVGIIVMYNDQDVYTHSVGTATGWTKIAENLTSTGRDMHTSVWWKRFTSGSETNPVATVSTGEQFSASVHVYRGVDTVLDPVVQYNFDDNLQDTPTGEQNTGSVSTQFANACIQQTLCMSHDDVVTRNTPTGFTDGEGIWGSAKDYRQQTTAYDLNVGTAGSKNWTNFTHDLNNQVCEYHMYMIVLEENQPIHVTDVDTDEKIQPGQEGVIVTGDGFETSQGTGKVELASSSDYATATKVAQTIDTWSSDTQITIDVVQGALSEGVVYLFVTNDSGDRTAAFPVVLGFGPYDPVGGMDERPDHWWTMNNTVDDAGWDTSYRVDLNNANTYGTPTFVATPICRTNTHSLEYNARTDGYEPGDSKYMNITNQHTRRRLGGWIRLESAQKLPGVIFEEGGGVNNIYFVVGYGATLFANIEDDGDFAIQAYCDFSLTLGRPYHIICCFDGSNDGNEFYMLVDGVKQTRTSGNPPGKANQVTHGGNMTFGDPQQNLQTGGQDIAYSAADDILLACWGTWCVVGDGIPSDTEIKEELFENGALAKETISAGTQAVMQADIDDNDDTTLADWPLYYDIEAPSSGGPDLELTLTNQVFDDRITLHARWRGGGVLTIRNSGTSNFDNTKVHTPNGGSVSKIDTALAKVTVRDIVSKAVISGARVLLLADTGGSYPSGVTVTIANSGTTATVTHTSHGLLTGDKVQILGASHQENNGVFTITVTAANTYTYTMSQSPGSSPTGTIKATFVVLDGDSDVSGEIENEIDFTSSQPVTGRVRKNTSSPYYKTSAIVGTITSAGLDTTVFMIGDGS